MKKLTDQALRLRELVLHPSMPLGVAEADGTNVWMHPGDGRLAVACESRELAELVAICLNHKETLAQLVLNWSKKDDRGEVADDGS